MWSGQRLRVRLLWGLVGGVIACPSVWATMGNLKSYKQAYPDKEAAVYSCKVCHQGAIGKKGDLNALGAALQAFKTAAGTDAKALTVDDFRTFEAADQDDDGATNQQELDAGTDLADPASVSEQPQSAAP